jgi:excisionase family DNA binding protein
VTDEMNEPARQRRPSKPIVQNETLARTRLLTVAQAARILSLREGTLRVWIAARRIPVVRLGRAVRIPEKAVEDLIAANTIPAREGRG